MPDLRLGLDNEMDGVTVETSPPDPEEAGIFDDTFDDTFE